MIRAPFTDEQVASINGFQKCDHVHPFTCGGEKCRADLVATNDGLICEFCDYKQNWVHEFMADGSWNKFEHFFGGDK